MTWPKIYWLHAFNLGKVGSDELCPVAFFYLFFPFLATKTQANEKAAKQISSFFKNQR